MSIMLTPPKLISCDQEQIHIPGSIQPHGLLLAVRPDDLLVRHVAGAIEQRLGWPLWQDQPLSDLVGPVLGMDIAALLEPEATGGFVGQLLAPDGEVLDVTAHLSGGHIIVELEPASRQGLSASRVMERVAMVVSGFEKARTITALCERAALEFRRLTGFDRVMVYRFLDDQAGQVLAEDRRLDLGSFLGHHFPATDIPRQARELYLRNLIRVIPDAAYAPVPLRPDWTGAAPLDMSDCSLRSVSPVHLAYLRNMGVKASASFSIVSDGTLWGLIACHHETPRLLTYDVRAACRPLVGSLAREIKTREEAESYRQRIRLRSFEDGIEILLSREGSLGDMLSRHLGEIGRMMGASGVAILRQNKLLTDGLCPNDEQIRGLAAWLTTDDQELAFSTDRLPELYPPAAAYQAYGSGLLAVIVSGDEPWFMLWFRAEQIETIRWAGNPHKMAHPDPAQPLNPRASFDAWAETVRGRSRPWTLPEIDAAIRLRVVLQEGQRNRRVLELNHQLAKILQDKDLLLRQKDFLIGEVNHRIQNSISLVSSFLGLQSRASGDPALQAALEEARRRLAAVGLVHRRLYRGDQIEVVDTARYIEELCADTFAFMGHDWSKHLRLSLAPVLVTTDRAVTLGLVLTELLINANKYAYEGAAGPIHIDLSEDLTHLHMVVSDQGSGRTLFKRGFGTGILEALVAQLHGDMVHSDNQPGLRVAIHVPLLVA
jgi:light-regulated signal transduction histidine kinase (bacteriophytochrome)